MSALSVFTYFVVKNFTAAAVCAFVRVLRRHGPIVHRPEPRAVDNMRIPSDVVYHPGALVIVCIHPFSSIIALAKIFA
jgi:hypothetical protein